MIKKKYNPKDIEEFLYNIWKKSGYFKPNYNIKKNSFCIIMPPPNITGNLHMGHAFQHTIMDILIRYSRMKGNNTLWQIGMDHAGIATQIIVSKKIILQKNTTLNKIGRNQFIHECWKWKKKFNNNINYQIQRLGSSVDWSRERFTLDSKISNNVQKIFIDLYENNLIYRKKKLSNWDIELKTVISDLELDDRIIKGKVWYIKYLILENYKLNYKPRYLVVSTTRLETLLGDTAIAVNPMDIRYKFLIGKYVKVPLLNRYIPIISDKHADINKGTGCVKITPAHDFNDYEVALRHRLPMINIFTKSGNICYNSDIYDIDGNISDIYNSYIPNKLKNLDRLLIRKKIIYLIRQLHLLDNIIYDSIIVTYGDRSGSKIEPMLTDQWYLRVSLLSKDAILSVKNGYIQFIPKQYKNMYLSWMKNIQDWCISRQLWWGHRIPAWYDSLGNVYVGKDEKNIREKYLILNNEKLIQDNDVLDTWFSSSLWTFLSLDWPEKKILNIFHPTTVLVSGFDIIFFWIARMIMMTMYCVQDNTGKPQIPFKTVYITGLIRDKRGQKMSKSKGNVLDPLDIIDGISFTNLLKKRTSHVRTDNFLNKIYDDTSKYFSTGIKNFGADALRFTFSSLSSINRNVSWDMNRLQGYRNFCNKIWNAGQFILIYVDIKDINIKNIKKYFLFFDYWIFVELNNTIKMYCKFLKLYRFDLASNELYNFFWHKFCDWYLELVKVIFKIGSLEEITSVKYTLVSVFEIMLRLLHPIIPFVTETIWINIKKFLSIIGETIMLQAFPSYDLKIKNYQIINFMNIIQKIILFIRQTRITLKLHTSNLVYLYISNIIFELQEFLLKNKRIIQEIGYLKDILILSSSKIEIYNSVVGLVDNIQLFIVL
ncbi:Valine--tRNA ligase [Buchnera aphidicola (Phyllaphis fagi)]|uniref:valine--tRNA ligase n=1 Tax=Buchnera aphidicola TaxID=9 RepID=UPI0034643CBC